MKILDWINKILRKNTIKLLEAPKKVENENLWKEEIRTPSNEEAILQKISQQELRIQQIKSVEFLVLVREGYLKKEEIIKSIEGKYQTLVISEADIQSLISLDGIIEYEDMHGDYNIREFIEENQNNIIELIDKMIEYAKEEANKNETEDIVGYIPIKREVINKIKNDIVQENENDSEKVG